ncbi:MAG: type II toxin-antitoxin system CcdA family antitoxin [Candidatus Brockarchaeota archaeon]|nr:type II toxin-antitoxin system CcdA family antitoxin [Candidatus Brockarchaeota archaeon]MBO3808836.1 type II toxin-antitoxin system CcdA family antitoxin [Candidatus Brockarchaeota archaeon]
MAYVTVSAKIDRELREKLRKYGIPVSKVVRKALEEEVRRVEEEEVRKALQRIGGVLEKIPSEEIAALIREGREER